MKRHQKQLCSTFCMFLLPYLSVAFSTGSGGEEGSMSCDAVNICAGGNWYCPHGMEYVAAPTRDNHYSIRTKGDAPFDLARVSRGQAPSVGRLNFHSNHNVFGWGPSKNTVF